MEQSDTQRLDFMITLAAALASTQVEENLLIDIHKILNRSGFEITQNRSCPSLKRGQWKAVARTMTGDAPKDFLRVYEYGVPNCRRSSPNSWPRFIAKVGHKWYPNESVTEHLLTRIGQSLGLNIADSRLVHVQGQLRFMSRYFLSDSEYLVHGADVFAFLLEDPSHEFISSIEAKNRSPDFFDYEFVVDSIKAMFPVDADSIVRDFHRMLAFDALIGNNDRHFFNWAVICDQYGSQPPRFSPIFDTARALFWNHSENRMYNITESESHDSLRKYCRKSYSKIGSPTGRANHLKLMQSILRANPSAVIDLNILAGIEAEPVDLLKDLFKGEFSRLMSPIRKTWISRLVEYRTEQFRLVLNGEPTDV